MVTPRVHHRQGYRQQRGKHPFYFAPSSTEIVCAAHRLSRPETIGRHLRASNEMIHGDFGIMILIMRLWMKHYIRKYSSPSDPQVPQTWRGGPLRKGFSWRSNRRIGKIRKRKKRKDIMLKAGQSRGSIVCVNGIMHYKTWWFLIKRFPWTKW